MAIPVPENLLPAYLRESDRVIYSDGNVHGSLYWLSFCQICKELRNKKGMVEEIEQHRCTSCLETFTLTENNEKEKRYLPNFDHVSYDSEATKFSTFISFLGTDGTNRQLFTERYSYCLWFYSIHMVDWLTDWLDVLEIWLINQLINQSINQSIDWLICLAFLSSSSCLPYIFDHFLHSLFKF